MSGVRQIGLFLLLSIGIVLGAHYLVSGSHWLMTGYQSLIGMLQSIFAANNLGHFLSAFIALLGVPILLSGAVALVYWTFKRHALPHYWFYLWAVWLVLTTLIISQG